MKDNYDCAVTAQRYKEWTHSNRHRKYTKRSRDKKVKVHEICNKLKKATIFSKMKTGWDSHQKKNLKIRVCSRNMKSYNEKSLCWSKTSRSVFHSEIRKDFAVLNKNYITSQKQTSWKVQ